MPSDAVLTCSHKAKLLLRRFMVKAISMTGYCQHLICSLTRMPGCHHAWITGYRNSLFIVSCLLKPLSTLCWQQLLPTTSYTPSWSLTMENYGPCKSQIGNHRPCGIGKNESAAQGNEISPLNPPASPSRSIHLSWCLPLFCFSLATVAAPHPSLDEEKKKWSLSMDGPGCK